MNESIILDPAIRAEELDGGRIVYVEGDLGVARIAALRRVLLENLRPGGTAILDLSRVESIDLSGLQLVCSAYRTYQQHGAAFSLRGASEDLRRTARQAGFRTKPGTDGEGAPCIWGN